MAEVLKLIPLSRFGLVTVEQAAQRKGCDPSTVRRWAAKGLIPVLVIGEGRSAKFLLLEADVDAYTPNPVGAPAGNRNAKKERTPKKKGSAGQAKKK